MTFVTSRLTRVKKTRYLQQPVNSLSETLSDYERLLLLPCVVQACVLAACESCCVNLVVAIMATYVITAV